MCVETILMNKICVKMRNLFAYIETIHAVIGNF